MIYISIIIPCYNSGQYLPDAVNSVRDYKGTCGYEIILIDDGSTDCLTVDLLNNYRNDEDIILIRQHNKGLSNARNRGCQIARGEFLLFLDSDNRVLPEYIETGITELTQDSQVGIVYGKPRFFGDGSRNGYQVQNFDIDSLLIGNYIDACAIVRKKAWESVAGYDESLRSFEDYDFWLSLYEQGWKFKFINKELYEYRIVNTSMIGAGKQEFFYETAKKIRTKHHDLWLQRFEYLKSQNDRLKQSKEMKIGNILLAPLRYLLNRNKP